MVVHPEDKEETAFPAEQDLWKFTVMSFGTCNAPATFESLTESVLHGLTYEPCLVYLHDVIIVGSTNAKSAQISERFRNANLKLNPKKCNLLRQETVLGQYRLS